MSDFFTNLALRSLGSAEIIRPRLPALFEPPPPNEGLATVAGIISEGTNQEPPEEIALENGVQPKSITDHSGDTFFHEPPVRTVEKSQPRLSSILRLSHEVAASGNVPPESGQKPREEIAPETAPEVPATKTRIAALREQPPRTRSSELRVAGPLTEKRSHEGLLLPEAPTARAVDLSPHKVTLRQPVAPPPADRRQPAAPNPALSPAPQPVVSPSLLPAEPQSNGVKGVAVRPARMTTSAGGGEPPLRESERLYTTATETDPRCSKTEFDSHLPQVDSHPLTAATRAEVRYSPADHSPPTHSLIAPSRAVPRDENFMPITPLRRSNSSEPTIQVTIGRIEVRAISQPAAAPRDRSASRVMPLDEYLRRRSRRGGE
jgi:hypothetical protein